jgi:Sec-independent protein translocase protein TatA
MNIGVVGILLVFAVFIVLIATNPRLSCFGKKIASPFYPLFRRKRMARESELRRKERLKQMKTEDYGFRLDEAGEGPSEISEKARKKAKTADEYGLKLDD